MGFDRELEAATLQTVRAIGNRVVAQIRGWRIVFRLLGRMIGTIAGATFLVFFILENSINGGFRSVILPPGTDETTARSRSIIDTFHLDENLLVRYLYWLTDAVRGDFGRSMRGDVKVTDVLTHRLPITLEVMLVGVFLTILIAVPLGLWAATLAERRRGVALSAFFGLSQSIPVFLTPVFLVWLFAVKLQWLPAAGWVRISDSLGGNLKNLILPMAALVFAEIGAIARIVRADVGQVLQSDFIAAAVGKGLSRPYILFRHAFRPASLGLLNLIGLNIGSLLSGAVVIEIIFGIGGLGQVLLEATISRDLHLLLGLTTFSVVVYVVLGTLVDALMYFADPRIRRYRDSSTSGEVSTS